MCERERERAPRECRIEVLPRLPSCFGSVVERIWHIQDSQGQILASTFKIKSLKPVKVFPLRAEAGKGWVSQRLVHSACKGSRARNTINPRSGTTPQYFSIASMCTTGRRFPASASTNQGLANGDLIPPRVQGCEQRLTCAAPKCSRACMSVSGPFPTEEGTDQNKLRTSP